MVKARKKAKASSSAPANSAPAVAGRAQTYDEEPFLPPAVTVLVVFALTAVGIYFRLLGWPWIIFAAAAGARALAPGTLVSEGDHDDNSDHED